MGLVCSGSGSRQSQRSIPMTLPLLFLFVCYSSPEASAFTPPFPIVSPHPIRSGISEINNNERTSTQLFAKKKKKKNGKKTPKMPTLPVATSTPNVTPTTDDANYNSATNNDKPIDISTMVIMDVENIRGATSFRISHEALISRIRLWRKDRLTMASSKSTGGGDAFFLEPLLWVCDHGVQSSIHHFSLDDEGGSGGSITGGRDNDAGQKKIVEMPHNFGAMFAGPGGRTADDVIVDVVELRCKGGGGKHIRSNITNGSVNDDVNSTAVLSSSEEYRPSPLSKNNTIVITGDTGLISRCQQARRKANSPSDVIFVEPTSLLQQLERYRINGKEEESYFGQQKDPMVSRQTPVVKSRRAIMEDPGTKRKDGKTNTMKSFRESSIAAEQHARFQARFQNQNSQSAVPEEDTDTAPSTAVLAAANDKQSPTEEDESEVEKPQHNPDAAFAAQLKTEQIRRQLLLSDAFYLATPSKSGRGSRRAQSTAAAVHWKYKTRNISKKQQKKLYQKRFGRKKKENMVVAAVTRKELAVKLQMNLEANNKKMAVDSEDDETGNDPNDSCAGDFDENGMMVRSMRLLETLLGKFEQERMRRKTGVLNGDCIGDQSTISSPHSATILPGLDTTMGRVTLNDKWDPLGSTLSVPLPKDLQDDSNGDNSKDGSFKPLRIVVISDTHGFEGGLSKYTDPSKENPSSHDEHDNEEDEIHLPNLDSSDDFLLPQADLLLHCGDFAASGSRKTQRMAARRLDDFLARQTHIPEKIVIKGNHDPESPAKVLFPASKALYVRSSSTLVVNGVRFTIEPFSRRMQYRSSVARRGSKESGYAASQLAKCDVFVTHEPPKGTLDLTYHGFAAGSTYLRELVEHAPQKPRLWLCGHIHESRGVMTRKFGWNVNGDNSEEAKEDASPTMVINASNANSGRASRIVSGAVVVEVERHRSSTTAEGGVKQTAESTLVSKKEVNYNDFGSLMANTDNGDAGLAGLGEDLELYVTRPGVRRRKGLTSSMRQQLKHARSSLVTSKDNN